MADTESATLVEGPILIETVASITSVILNRPKKHNAISYDMWPQIRDIFKKLSNDPDTRVIVIRGIGNSAFSSGADISEFRNSLTNRDMAIKYWAVVNEANSAIEDCGKPVFAMINVLLMELPVH